MKRYICRYRGTGGQIYEEVVLAKSKREYYKFVCSTRRRRIVSLTLAKPEKTYRIGAEHTSASTRFTASVHDYVFHAKV